jgi:hypothetical protein
MPKFSLTADLVIMADNEGEAWAAIANHLMSLAIAKHECTELRVEDIDEAFFGNIDMTEATSPLH